MSKEDAAKDVARADEETSVCSICSVSAVTRCQRCLSIVYCSKECQQRGWSGINTHRKICAQIKKAKEKVEEEAKKLKTFKRLKGKMPKKPKDCDFEENNLFETSVGTFWNIKEAHSYCESRLELALALRECGAQNKSLLAVEIALEHLLALLKLTGGDQMKVISKTVPSLFLFLGKEKQAYNFIKWWVNFEDGSEKETDWNTIDFRELESEDITEVLNWRDFTTQQVTDIALAKIKAKVALEREIGFGVTLKDMDQQLQELFSILKDLNEIVWKFICDPEGMETKLNQEMGDDPMVFIDPKGDMKEALDVRRNTSFVWKSDVNVQDFVSKFIGSKETLTEASQNSEWSKHLGKKKYSWLVDCYRLRMDDDYAWGDCNLHGLYEDSSPLNIAEDFIVFCALAARNEVIPMIWDWNLFFEEASKKLSFAYEKSDAREDWGMLGPMILRTTADLVYGGGPDDADDTMCENIHDELDSASEEFFKDIGGVKNWVRLVNWLEQDNYKPNTNFVM